MTTVDDADGVFAALADPTRREVVRALASAGSATATELAEGMPVPRQAIVKHLGALADAGLVGAERAGREVRYHLTPAPMTDAVAWLTSVGADWDDRLARLKKVVER